MTDFDQGRIFALKYIEARAERLLGNIDDESVALGICLISGIAKAYVNEIKKEAELDEVK